MPETFAGIGNEMGQGLSTPHGWAALWEPYGKDHFA